MRNIWVVLITFIVTAGVVGAGGWWYMDGKITSEKKDLQTRIDTLNTELDALKVFEASSSQSSETSESASEDENLYTDSQAYFSFTLPDGWEIKNSYYYETAGGEKARVPTVIIARKSNTAEENTNKIFINMRQSSCDQLASIPDRSEPAGSQSVEVYIASESEVFVSPLKLPPKTTAVNQRLLILSRIMMIPLLKRRLKPLSAHLRFSKIFALDLF